MLSSGRSSLHGIVIELFDVELFIIITIIIIKPFFKFECNIFYLPIGVTMKFKTNNFSYVFLIKYFFYFCQYEYHFHMPLICKPLF